MAERERERERAKKKKKKKKVGEQGKEKKKKKKKKNDRERAKKKKKKKKALPFFWPNIANQKQQTLFFFSLFVCFSPSDLTSSSSFSQLSNYSN